MPQYQFAAQILNAWDSPDYTWIRLVRKHAKFLWVRVVGLNETEYDDQDAGHILRWESVATRLTPNRRRCATLILVFSRETAEYKWNEVDLKHYGMVDTAKARNEWPRTMKVAARLGVMLRWMRELQPYQIGVFAEDFSARWLQESGFVPNVLVADNPMVSTDEARGHPLWGAPGFVRRSRWSAMGRYDYWKLPFAEDRLLPGINSAARHGRWHLDDLSRPQIDAIMFSRPCVAQ